MRIFVAGATGALGSRLVPLLVKAGHEVIGTSRDESRLADLEAIGAEGVVMDGLDAESVLRAVTTARPDVIVHQLTALGGMTGDPRKFDQDFAVTNKLRTQGTDNLLAAARAAGVRRFIAQSYVGWNNARTGTLVKTEDDPSVDVPDKEARESFTAIRYVEQTVTAAEGIEGLVLRYGNFYGTGNALSKAGLMAELLRKRRFPVVGGGTGVWTFIHIDDAAAATAAAVERGAPGIYNIVDDEPAPIAQWLPFLAEQVGAKPPMRLPAWLAKPMLGQLGVAMMTTVRGSSNAKAKRELAWAPQYPSFREGFRDGIG